VVGLAAATRRATPQSAGRRRGHPKNRFAGLSGRGSCPRAQNEGGAVTSLGSVYFLTFFRQWSGWPRQLAERSRGQRGGAEAVQKTVWRVVDRLPGRRRLGEQALAPWRVTLGAQIGKNEGGAVTSLGSVYFFDVFQAVVGLAAATRRAKPRSAGRRRGRPKNRFAGCRAGFLAGAARVSRLSPPGGSRSAADRPNWEK
jgi:hypothetical protein